MKDNIERIELRIGEVIPGIPQTNLMRIRLVNCAEVTFASHFVMAGVGLKTVQELLGHQTYQMTLRYAHLSPDHRKAAVNVFCSRMDTIWSPVAVPTTRG